MWGRTVWGGPGGGVGAGSGEQAGVGGLVVQSAWGGMMIGPSITG